VWGAGRHGQLGHVNFDDCKLPKLNMALQKARVQLAAVGFQHSAAVTEDGRLLTWGHGHRGRLGIGTSVRKSVAPPWNRCFPEPTLVPTFTLTNKVKQVVLAVQHWSEAIVQRCNAPHGIMCRRYLCRPTTAFASRRMVFTRGDPETEGD